jgi:hypothetical protein
VTAGGRAAAGLAWFLAAGPLSAACPPAPADGALLSAGAVQAAWRVDGAAIAVGRHFTLLVQVCPAEVQLLKVDASMPAHRHGMNYRPGLVALGDGRWRAEGLMFHMAGAWELRFDVEAGGRTEHLADTVQLP